MLDSHENFETLRICKIKKIKKKVPDDVEEKTEEEGEREALWHCNIDNDGDCQDSPHCHLPPPIRLVCTN